MKMVETETTITTIALSQETKDELEGMKVHPRESYEDVIKRLLKRKEA